MNKTEAREVLKQHNLWRRDEAGILRDLPSQTIGEAIDTITQPNEIADSIRKAAIDWPQFADVVERNIIFAFAQPSECGRNYTLNQFRTFLLFIAEALES